LVKVLTVQLAVPVAQVLVLEVVVGQVVKMVKAGLVVLVQEPYMGVVDFFRMEAARLTVVVVQFVLFGLVQLGDFRQQTLVIYNEFIHSS
jgi:hypothetical protein